MGIFRFEAAEGLYMSWVYSVTYFFVFGLFCFGSLLVQLLLGCKKFPLRFLFSYHWIPILYVVSLRWVLGVGEERVVTLWSYFFCIGSIKGGSWS